MDEEHAEALNSRLSTLNIDEAEYDDHDAVVKRELNAWQPGYSLYPHAVDLRERIHDAIRRYTPTDTRSLQHTYTRAVPQAARRDGTTRATHQCGLGDTSNGIYGLSNTKDWKPSDQYITSIGQQNTVLRERARARYGIAHESHIANHYAANHQINSPPAIFNNVGEVDRRTPAFDPERIRQLTLSDVGTSVDFDLFGWSFSGSTHRTAVIHISHIDKSYMHHMWRSLVTEPTYIRAYVNRITLTTAGNMLDCGAMRLCINGCFLPPRYTGPVQVAALALVPIQAQTVDFHEVEQGDGRGVYIGTKTNQLFSVQVLGKREVTCARAMHNNQTLQWITRMPKPTKCVVCMATAPIKGLGGYELGGSELILGAIPEPDSEKAREDGNKANNCDDASGQLFRRYLEAAAELELALQDTGIKALGRVVNTKQRLFRITIEMKDALDTGNQAIRSMIEAEHALQLTDQNMITNRTIEVADEQARMRRSKTSRLPRHTTRISPALPALPESTIHSLPGGADTDMDLNMTSGAKPTILRHSKSTITISWCGIGFTLESKMKALYTKPADIVRLTTRRPMRRLVQTTVLNARWDCRFKKKVVRRSKYSNGLKPNTNRNMPTYRMTVATGSNKGHSSRVVFTVIEARHHIPYMRATHERIDEYEYAKSINTRLLPSDDGSTRSE